MHRLVMYALLSASVFGVFHFYGKLQYNKGVAHCERNILKHRDDYAQFLARSYEQAFEHNTLNFQKSQEVRRQILNLPSPPHQRILEACGLSPCKHLGDDVVGLFNDFTQTESSYPFELRNARSDERKDKKQDS